MMLSCIYWLFLLPLAGQIVVCHLFSSSSTEFAVLESSPVVGSSRKRTEGSIMSSMPMLVLFRSPPEIPRISWVPTWPQKKFTTFFPTTSCFCLVSVSSLSSPWSQRPGSAPVVQLVCSLSALCLGVKCLLEVVTQQKKWNSLGLSTFPSPHHPAAQKQQIQNFYVS